MDTTLESIADELQAVRDRQACEDLLVRYCRTLDWLDEEGQAACFWPDAVVDYGFFQGSGEEWVAVVMEVERSSVHRWHGSAGAIIKVEGNGASGESYGLSLGSVKNDAGELVDTLFGGRYLDEFEKWEGSWRIAKRRYVADWVHSFPNGLANLAESGLTLNQLQIPVPGHEAYRVL